MATGHPTAQIAAPAARNGTGSRDTSVPAREGDALFRDIFRCFPYGILVVDATGAVVLSNPEAERLLGGRIRPGSTCCTLLGCRDESGPLDGACLTELALERGSRLAEVRIDLPGTERAAWVTAAPLDAEPTRVLVELRPGHRKDRRQGRIEELKLPGKVVEIATGKQHGTGAAIDV